MGTNEKRNRTHLELKPGDKVLVRLGQRKTVESDHYTVLSTRGNDITARNDNSGRILRRHLSRFTKIGESTEMKKTETDSETQTPVTREDPAEEREDGPPFTPILNEGQPQPLIIPQPRQPQPIQDGLEQDQQARNEQPQDRRNVQFHPRAHTAEYDPNSAISPQRTTRSSARSTGVPVPDFPTTAQTLEYSRRAQNTAQELLDQFRNQTEAQRNQQQPPQD